MSDDAGGTAGASATVTVRARFGIETYVVAVERRPLETTDGVIDRARQRIREEHDPTGPFVRGRVVDAPR